jgi:hypothetical protein
MHDEHNVCCWWPTHTRPRYRPIIAKMCKYVRGYTMDITVEAHTSTLVGPPVHPKQHTVSDRTRHAAEPSNFLIHLLDPLHILHRILPRYPLFRLPATHSIHKGLELEAVSGLAPRVSVHHQACAEGPGLTSTTKPCPSQLHTPSPSASARPRPHSCGPGSYATVSA